MATVPNVCSQHHAPWDKTLDAYHPEVNWRQTLANHLSFSDEASNCFAVVEPSPRLLNRRRLFVFLHSENLCRVLSGLLFLYLYTHGTVVLRSA